MIKELWEESSKRGTRIGSIVMFPLIFVVLAILSIGYIIFIWFSNVIDTYTAVIERCTKDD